MSDSKYHIIPVIVKIIIFALVLSVGSYIALFLLPIGAIALVFSGLFVLIGFIISIFKTDKF